MTKTRTRTAPMKSTLAPDFFPDLWATYGEKIKLNEAEAAAAARELVTVTGGALSPVVVLRKSAWWAS